MGIEFVNRICESNKINAESLIITYTIQQGHEIFSKTFRFVTSCSAVVILFMSPNTIHDALFRDFFPINNILDSCLEYT